MRAITTSLLLMLGPAALGAQWTVDPAGGGQFTSLQAAIDAASGGDTILVKGGCYRGIVFGKPLSILGSGTLVTTTGGTGTAPSMPAARDWDVDRSSLAAFPLLSTRSS